MSLRNALIIIALILFIIVCVVFLFDIDFKGDEDVPPAALAFLSR
jgi:hypothetical protein